MVWQHLFPPPCSGPWLAWTWASLGFMGHKVCFYCYKTMLTNNLLCHVHFPSHFMPATAVHSRWKCYFDLDLAGFDSTGFTWGASFGQSCQGLMFSVDVGKNFSWDKNRWTLKKMMLGMVGYGIEPWNGVGSKVWLCWWWTSTNVAEASAATGASRVQNRQGRIESYYSTKGHFSYHTGGFYKWRKHI